MHKFLIALAILVPLLALAHLAHANGNDDDNNGSNHHNTTTTNNTTSNSTMGVTADQDNSIVFGSAAPGLAGSGVDCNVVSKSYSIVLWSYGRAECEAGSVAWRDFEMAIKFGLGEAVALGMLCKYKAFRKLSHNVSVDGVPLDCKTLLRKPKKQTKYEWRDVAMREMH